MSLNQNSCGVDLVANIIAMVSSSTLHLISFYNSSQYVLHQGRIITSLIVFVRDHLD